MSFRPIVIVRACSSRQAGSVGRVARHYSPPDPKRNDHPIHRVRSQLQQSIGPSLQNVQADLARRTNNALASAARHATVLGLKLNEVTGYHEVERLKVMVSDQEANLAKTRNAARQAKIAYDTAVADRSTSQREVNSLLERKHSWTDADVSAFTTLVRTDHASTAAVASTSTDLKEKELAVDKAFTDLTSAILQRYHEEQVWSDKIRSVSTWANVIGLIFNFLIFVVAIAIVEPWKRRRLVERVEERMTSLVDGLDLKVQDVARMLETEMAKGSVEDVPEPVDLLPEGLALQEGAPSPLLQVASDRLSKMLGYEVIVTPQHSHAAAGVAGAIVGTAIWSLVSALTR